MIKRGLRTAAFVDKNVRFHQKNLDGKATKGGRND